MEELISRQAVLEEVHKELYEWFGLYDDDGESPIPFTGKDKELLRINKRITKRIKALPSAEQGWISVKDRLPNPNEIDEDGVLKYYLVQNEFGDMMVASYRRSASGWTWWEQMYAHKPVTETVIAWMPLPEPWKGEDDAEVH